MSIGIFIRKTKVLLFFMLFLLSSGLTSAANVQGGNNDAYGSEAEWLDFGNFTVANTAITNDDTSGTCTFNANGTYYTKVHVSGANGALSGWAWCDNIGWLRLSSNTNTSNTQTSGNVTLTESSSNHGVYIDSNGYFRGYAYSPDLDSFVSFYDGISSSGSVQTTWRADTTAPTVNQATLSGASTYNKKVWVPLNDYWGPPYWTSVSPNPPQGNISGQDCSAWAYGQTVKTAVAITNNYICLNVYYSTSSSLTFLGAPSDSGSGLADCEARIMSTDSSSAATQTSYPSIGTDGDHTISATAGYTYYYSYRCTDNVGNTSAWTSWSPGFISDTTAPTVTTPTLSGASTASNKIWVPLNDYWGPPYYHQVSPNTPTGNIAGQSCTSWSVGQTVKTAVAITNNYICLDVYYNNASSLTFLGSPSDALSGLDDCEGRSKITDSTNAASSNSYASVGTDGGHAYAMTDGYTTYYSYRCTDNAGNTSAWTSWSPGFRRDSTNPTTPGNMTTTWSGDHYVNTSFTANTTGSTDANSGVRGYRLCRSHDNNSGCSVWVNAESASTSALVSGSHLPTNGTYRNYYWYTYDNVGNQAAPSGSVYVRLDTTAPNLNAPSDEGTYKNSTTLNFSSSPSDADSGLSECYAQIDVNNTDGASLAMNTTAVGTDGDHAFVGSHGNTYYYRYYCSDVAGNNTAWSSWSDGITIDTAAPLVPTPTDAGAYSQTTSITFTANPSDAQSGLLECWAQIDVNNTDGASLAMGTTAVGADGDYGFTSAVHGNTYYYRYYCQDNATNSSSWSAWSDGIYVDTVVPSVSANNASSTWYASRTATISATDSGSGILEVRYSWNSNAMNGACTSGGTVSSNGANLTVPSGSNRLYLCARDNAQRTSTWDSGANQYRVDTTDPTTPGNMTTSWTGDHYVNTSFNASTSGSTDSQSGLRGYRLCRSHDNNSGCSVWVAAESISLPVTVSGSHLPSNGAYRNYYWYAYDNVGNESAPSGSVYVRMDTTPPTIDVNYGQDKDVWYTGSPNIQWQLSTAGGLGPNRFAWAWDSWPSTTPPAANASSGSVFTTSHPEYGSRILYGRVWDELGNRSDYSATYHRDITAPTVSAAAAANSEYMSGDRRYVSNSGPGNYQTTNWSFDNAAWIAAYNRGVRTWRLTMDVTTTGTEGYLFMWITNDSAKGWVDGHYQSGVVPQNTNGIVTLDYTWDNNQSAVTDPGNLFMEQYQGHPSSGNGAGTMEIRSWSFSPVENDMTSGWTNSTNIEVPAADYDEHSGISSCYMERAEALISAGAVGSYGSYSTVQSNCNDYTFTGDKGKAYKFRYNATDNVGLSSSYESSEVKLASTPSVVSVTPNSTTMYSDYQTETFTVVYRDSDGPSNITQAYLNIVDGTESAKEDSFYAYYNPQDNHFYFYGEPTWTDAGAAGSVTEVCDNYTCIEPGSTASTNGSDLTVTWKVRFKGQFVGVKNIHATVLDKYGNSSGWADYGDLTMVNDIELYNVSVDDATPNPGQTITASAGIRYAGGGPDLPVTATSYSCGLWSNSGGTFESTSTRSVGSISNTYTVPNPSSVGTNYGLRFYCDGPDNNVASFGDSSSPWYDTDAGISNSTANVAPSNDSVTISSSALTADGSTTYTLTAKFSDINGVSTARQHELSINTNTGNGLADRGLFGWSADAALWPGNNENAMSCTGAGYAAEYTVNSAYIDLVSCNTTTSGNQRTINYIIHVNPGYGDVQNNDIAAYAADTGGLNSGYGVYDLNFDIVPAGPTGLSASAVNDRPVNSGQGRVNIFWTDNSGSETGFKIERKTGAGGSWSQIGTVGANATSYPDAPTDDNTLYYYRVRSYTAGGDSAYSNEASATTFDTTAPQKVSVTMSTETDIANTIIADNKQNYTVTAIASDENGGSNMDQIQIIISQATGSWTNARGYFVWDTDGYIVGGDQIACSGGGYASKATGGYGDTTVTLTGCSSSVSGNNRTVNFTFQPNDNWDNNQSYDIGMYAVDENANNTAWTNEDKNFNVRPSSPKSLAVSVFKEGENSHSGKVTLKWNPSAGASVTGYSILRKVAGGASWSGIASVPNGTYWYTDATVSDNTAYEYSVVAYSSGGDSHRTNTKHVYIADHSGANSYTVTPLDNSSRRLYMNFDDPTNMAADFSGYKHHGTITGATSVAGEASKAINFDGNDSITLDSNPLDGATAATISFRIKWNADPTSVYQQVMIAENSVWLAHYNGKLGLDLKNDSSVWIDGNGGHNQGYVMPANSFTDLEWHDVTWTWDGANIRGYLDGVLVTGPAATPGISSIQTGNTPFGIGSRGAANYGNFKLDEFEMHNRAWGADEVAARSQMRDDDFAATAVVVDDIQDETSLDIKDSSENGLVAYYSFNNSSDLGHDDSGNYYDLSDNGGTSSLSVGYNRGAASFDGTDDYLYNTSLDTSADETFAVSFWANSTSSTNAYRRWFTTTTGSIGATSVVLRENNSGQVELYCGTNSAAITDSFRNQWHYYTVTNDGANCMLYRDGKKVISLPGMNDVQTSVYLGGHYNGSSERMQGYIDEFKVYNRSLSGQEINDAYKKESLAVYLKFDEGSGVTAYDSSTKGNNVGIVGSPWSTSGKSASAMYFDGADDYVTMSDNPFEFTGPQTISMWIKPEFDSSTYGCSIFSTYGGNYKGINVAGCDGNLRFIYYTSSSTVLDLPFKVNLNEWSYITLVLNDSKAKAYVNGRLYAELTHSLDLGIVGGIGATIGTGVWNIGSNALNFKGYIDEFSVHNRELPPSEIQENYQRGMPGVNLAKYDSSSTKYKNLNTVSSFSELNGQTIKDVFIYDTKKDTVSSSWRTNSSHSWYTETIDNDYENCNASSDDRCGTQKFPEKVLIISTTTNLYIYDATLERPRMWARIPDVPSSMIAVWNSGSVPSELFAKNGVIYLANATSGGQYGALVAIQFNQDRAVTYHSSGEYIYSGIFPHTGTSYANGNAGLDLINPSANSVYAETVNGKEYILVGTDNGATLLNLTDGNSVHMYQTAGSYTHVRGTHIGRDGVISFLAQNPDTSKSALITLPKIPTSDLSGAYWDDIGGDVVMYSYGGDFFKNGSGQGDHAGITNGTDSYVNDFAYDKDSFYIARNDGFTVLKQDNYYPEKSVFEFVDNVYHTLPLQGDVKGNWVESSTDRSNARNNLTNNGVTTTVAADSSEVVSFEFDGSDYMTSSASDFDITDNLTIGAWIKTTSSASSGVIIGKSDGSTAPFSPYSLALNGSGYVNFSTNGSGGVESITGSKQISDGAWHFVTAVYRKGGVGELYIDGELQAHTSGFDASLGTLASPLILGASYGAGSPYNYYTGSISMPFVIAEDYSAQEVANLYERTLPWMKQDVKNNIEGSSGNVSHIATKDNGYFVATAGGISEFDKFGKLVHTFNTGATSLTNTQIASNSVLNVSYESGQLFIAYWDGTDPEIVSVSDERQEGEILVDLNTTESQVPTAPSVLLTLPTMPATDTGSYSDRMTVSWTEPASNGQTTNYTIASEDFVDNNTNLLANPDFEGAASLWTSDSFGYSSAGGIVTSNQTNSGYRASSGKKFINAYNGGGVSQNVTVTNGTYRLCADMKVRSENNGGDASTGYLHLAGNEVYANTNAHDPNYQEYCMESVLSAGTVKVGVRSSGSSHAIIFDNLRLFKISSLSYTAPVVDYTISGSGTINTSPKVSTNSELATALSPNTQYTYNVYANDSAGNTSLAGSATAYTHANIPAAPTVTLPASITDSDSLIININTNSNPASTLYIVGVDDDGDTGDFNTEKWIQADGSLGVAGTALWQNAAAWANYDLQNLNTNQIYRFEVLAKNGDDVQTSKSAHTAIYTRAATPATASISLPASTADTDSILVDVNAGSNPTSVTYAIAVDDDADPSEFNTTKYVQADGTVNTTAVWQTEATWSTVDVNGLLASRIHRFKVKARNAENVESDFGPVSILYTRANNAGAITLSLPASTADTDSIIFSGIGSDSNGADTKYALYVDVDGNSTAFDSGYYVSAAGTSNGATPVWQSSAAWSSTDISGLGINRLIRARLMARNGNDVDAAAYTVSSPIYTRAAVPAAPTVNLNGADLTLSVNTNSNPTSPTDTLYEVKLVDSAPATTYLEKSGSDFIRNGAANTYWYNSTNYTNANITSLTGSMQYTISVRAKNGDGVLTDFGSTTVIETLPSNAASTLNVAVIRPEIESGGDLLTKVTSGADVEGYTSHWYPTNTTFKFAQSFASGVNHMHISWTQSAGNPGAGTLNGYSTVYDDSVQTAGFNGIWNSGEFKALPTAGGSWYLHVLAQNANNDNSPEGVHTYGPFYIDKNAPGNISNVYTVDTASGQAANTGGTMPMYAVPINGGVQLYFNQAAADAESGLADSSTANIQSTDSIQNDAGGAGEKPNSYLTYRVYADQIGDGTVQQIANISSAATSHTFTGLTNDQNYLLKIVTVDKSGNESSGVTQTITPTASFIDSDGDGLSNSQEISLGSNPLSADSDGDGLSDYKENQLGTSLTNSDTDGDGVNDGTEVVTGSNPTDNTSQPSDSDGDGLSDGFETSYPSATEASADTDGDGLTNLQEQQLGTNPTLADSDSDGLSDSVEKLYGLNPNDPNDASADNDGDGVSNADEITAGTNMNLTDTDGDGLDDKQEIAYGTNPLNSDSDGDGVVDGIEIISNTDPKSNSSTPTDTDGDGLTDSFETTYPTASDPNADTDGDGLTNLQEQQLGTNPTSTDTDGDGIPDSVEVNVGLDPNNAGDAAADADGDGVSNAVEITNGTDINNSDSDGDGLSDKEESLIGTDPLNNDSDGDGQEDGAEVNAGTSPKDNTSTFADADSDGLTDAFETKYPTATNPYADTDGDGLTNLEEQQLGTDPTNADTDNDGIQDGAEVLASMDPLNTADASMDNDGDGLTNKEELTYKTNPNLADSDGDGINDQKEIETYNTNPLDADSDNDGVKDGFEVSYGTDPLLQTDLDPDLDGVPENITSIDADQDGLTDTFESTYPTATDPYADPDGDGLTNLEEQMYNTNPTQADTDSDGINDNVEIFIGMNPNDVLDASADDDGDGLSNIEEVNAGTNIFKTDTDGDGLSDKKEISLGTDPTDSDTDNDGFNDALEITAGTDPISTTNTQAQIDADGDGLVNAFESKYPAIQSDPYGDADSDGVTNIEEQFYNTTPLKKDTDLDGVSDYAEISLGLDPTVANDVLLDNDADGVNNKEEYLNGTNINDPDDVGYEPVALSPIVVDKSSILWRWTRGNYSNEGYKMHNAVGDAELYGIGANAENYLETSLSPNTSYSRYLKEKYGEAWFQMKTNMTAVTLPAASDVVSGNSRSIDTWYSDSSFVFSSINLNNIAIDSYRYVWDQTADTTVADCNSATAWDSGNLNLTASTGSNYLHVIACNSVAANSEGTIHYGPYKFDNTGPTISSALVNQGDTYASSTSVNVQIAAVDSGGSGIANMRIVGDVATTYNDVYMPVKTMALSAGDGLKTVTIDVQDAAGNWSSTTDITITVDASTVTMGAISAKYSSASAESQLTDNWWSDNQPYFSWSASAGPSGVEGYSIAVDSSTNDVIDTTATDYAYTVSSLPEGSHTLTIKAQNGAGAWSSDASFIYKVDTINPSLSVTFPTNAGKYSAGLNGGNVTWATIAGTASDSTSGIQDVSVEIKDSSGDYWDGSSFQANQTWLAATGTTSWSYNMDIADLAEGTYTLRSRVRDNARIEGGTFNEIIDTRTFTIDKTVVADPTISPANSTEINLNTRPAISTEAGATVYVCLDQATTDGGVCETYTSHPVDSNNKYIFTDAIPLVANPTVKFYAIDEAGNRSNTVTISYAYKATLSSMNPSTGKVGDTITLTGASFGSSASTVKFGAVNASGADIVSWTDTQIQVKVPTGASSSTVSVVSSAIGESNGMNFTVIKDPSSVVLAPTGNFTMTVGEEKVFAAFAKDEDGNTVPGVTYVWSTTHGTISGAGTSVKTFSASSAGTAVITVDVGGGVTVDSGIITVYDPVSSSNLACATPASLRLDFKSKGLSGTPEGIDTGNTTSSVTNVKTYGSGASTIKINNYQGAGTVQSDDLYSGSIDINSIVLSKNDTLEGDAEIAYYVTFDGGTAWHQVNPGVSFNAPTGGTDVRWRAVMTGTSPVLHYVTLQMSSEQNEQPYQEGVVYANCSRAVYQVGSLEQLESGVQSAVIRGNYEVSGDMNNYQDPGPAGVYDGETDISLLKKYLGL